MDMSFLSSNFQGNIVKIKQIEKDWTVVIPNSGINSKNSLRTFFLNLKLVKNNLTEIKNDNFTKEDWNQISIEEVKNFLI